MIEVGQRAHDSVEWDSDSTSALLVTRPVRAMSRVQQSPIRAQIQKMGGPVSLGKLRVSVREALEPYDALARDILQSRWSGVRYQWVKSPRLWAAAGMDGKVPTVAMSYGTPLVIEEAFLALFSLTLDDAEVLKGSDWNAARIPSRLGFAARVGNGGGYWLVPRDARRQEAGRIAALFGFQFILLHELVHLMRGHSTPARRAFFVDKPRMRQSKRRRMFEIDADWHASALLTETGSWFNQLKEQKLAVAFTAIGVTLSLLDRGLRVAEASKSSYPHPLHRVFLAIDSMGLAVAHKFGFSGDMIQENRKNAYLRICVFAEMLGRVGGVWEKPSEAWSVDAYLAERAAYVSWELEGATTGQLRSAYGSPAVLLREVSARKFSKGSGGSKRKGAP